MPRTAHCPVNAAPATSIIECRPTRALFRPGERASIWVRAEGATTSRAHLRATAWDLDDPVATAETSLDPSGSHLVFDLSPTPGRGYGIDVELVDSGTGEVLARRSTAVDVQRSWLDAPRYGFLSEFGPGERYEQRADGLLERQVNAIQFYDWMYRHYELLPPEDTFVDGLGRTLALSSTRRAIEELHRRGIACMAYGSIYGAEPEYALQYPDELLYDAQRQPHSLDGAFFYQDVRPGRWRDRILREFRKAIARLGFDGIQADQYGQREPVFDAAGNPVDMPAALAGMVRASQEAVIDAGGVGIIFNCVNNWPIAAVSSEPQTCTYIELWPPYVRHRDLFELVENARGLARDRQVILAAYMSCAAADVGAAEEATLLTSAAIHASGGFHLFVGEGNAILTDPYFPKFVRPGPRFQQRLVAQRNFIVRHGAYLFDRSLQTQSVSWSDGVWWMHRRGSRFSTVSALNAHPDDLWDSVKPAPPTRTGVSIEILHEEPVEAVVIADPDTPGPARRIDFQQAGSTVRFTIPTLRTWTLAVLIDKE